MQVHPSPIAIDNLAHDGNLENQYKCYMILKTGQIWQWLISIGGGDDKIGSEMSQLIGFTQNVWLGSPASISPQISTIDLKFPAI